MKLVQTMGRILIRHSSAQAGAGENCTHRHEPPTVRTLRGKRTDALPASLLRSHLAGWCDLVVAERNRMVIRVARCGTRRTLANSERAITYRHDLSCKRFAFSWGHKDARAGAQGKGRHPVCCVTIVCGGRSSTVCIAISRSLARHAVC